MTAKAAAVDLAFAFVCVSVCVCVCVTVGEAKDRGAAQIPSSSGCGPGGTPGTHAISHCAVQRLLVRTGPVSGFVSAGPEIPRSAQEILALVARRRDRKSSSCGL